MFGLSKEERKLIRCTYTIRGDAFIVAILASGDPVFFSEFPSSYFTMSPDYWSEVDEYRVKMYLMSIDVFNKSKPVINFVYHLLLYYKYAARDLKSEISKSRQVRQKRNMAKKIFQSDLFRYIRTGDDADLKCAIEHSGMFSRAELGNLFKTIDKNGGRCRKFNSNQFLPKQKPTYSIQSHDSFDNIFKDVLDESQVDYHENESTEFKSSLIVSKMRDNKFPKESFHQIVKEILALGNSNGKYPRRLYIGIEDKRNADGELLFSGLTLSHFDGISNYTKFVDTISDIMSGTVYHDASSGASKGLAKVFYSIEPCHVNVDGKRHNLLVFSIHKDHMLGNYVYALKKDRNWYGRNHKGIVLYKKKRVKVFYEKPIPKLLTLILFVVVFQILVNLILSPLML